MEAGTTTPKRVEICNTHKFHDTVFSLVRFLKVLPSEISLFVESLCKEDEMLSSACTGVSWFWLRYTFPHSGSYGARFWS